MNHLSWQEWFPRPKEHQKELCMREMLHYVSDVLCILGRLR